MCEISEIPKTWWTPTHDTSEPGGKMAVAPCVVSTSRRSVERGCRSKRWPSIIRHTHLFSCYDSYLCPHSVGKLYSDLSNHLGVSQKTLGEKLLFIRPSYPNQDPTSSWLSHLTYIFELVWSHQTTYSTPLEKQTRNPKNWWFLFEVFPVPRGREPFSENQPFAFSLDVAVFSLLVLWSWYLGFRQ